MDLLQLYEEEKRIWYEHEAARQAAEEEALKFADLLPEEWDDIVSHVAKEKRESRPPAGTWMKMSAGYKFKYPLPSPKFTQIRINCQSFASYLLASKAQRITFLFLANYLLGFH